MIVAVNTANDYMATARYDCLFLGGVEAGRIEASLFVYSWLLSLGIVSGIIAIIAFGPGH
jgi:hypothetical protein